MRFNIITNLDNAHGLQREYEILRYELERRGHTVYGVQFNTPRDVHKVDVNLFVETVVPGLFMAASQQWVMPMPEWWLPAYHQCLSQLDHVLCKTHDCYRVFTALVGDKATYIGGLSGDYARPDIKRTLRYLHIAGKSTTKNTEAVLEAWYELPYQLALVTTLSPYIQVAKLMSNVQVYSQVSEDELVQLYNSCRFHVCPSKYEGWGHCLHEGQSTGAIIITTDAPPMNEFGTPRELLVPAKVEQMMRLAPLHKITAKDLIKKAVAAMQLTPGQLQRLSSQARHTFESSRQAFHENFSRFIASTC